MGKTDAERLQRWRDKGRAEGRKNISVLLSIDATKKLADIQGRTGESISGIVERLLLGKGPRNTSQESLKGPSSPIKDSGQTLDMEAIAKIRAGNKPAERTQVENLIRELRENEKFSHKKIADYLISQEVPTISGRGQWQAGAIGKMLKKWDIP